MRVRHIWEDIILIKKNEMPNYIYTNLTDTHAFKKYPQCSGKKTPTAISKCLPVQHSQSN